MMSAACAITKTVALPDRFSSDPVLLSTSTRVSVVPVITESLISQSSPSSNSNESSVPDAMPAPAGVRNLVTAEPTVTEPVPDVAVVNLTRFFGTPMTGQPGTNLRPNVKAMLSPDDTLTAAKSERMSMLPAVTASNRAASVIASVPTAVTVPTT